MNDESLKKRDKLISKWFGMYSDGSTVKKWTEQNFDLMAYAHDYRMKQTYPVWEGEEYASWPKFEENPAACVELLEKLSDAVVSIDGPKVTVGVGNYFKSAERLPEALPAAVYRWMTHQ